MSRKQPVAQRVDDGDADAVQAAGDLVGVVVELAAGVQDGEDDDRGVDGLARVTSIGPVGMPRPLSSTETEPSLWMITISIVVAVAG
jgi:hypothetical protein